MNADNSPLELFMEDNLAFDRDGKSAPVVGGASIQSLQEKPLWPDGLNPLPATQVREHVAENAGARPWDRDEIDRRIVRAAREGNGKIIHSEQEVGGYPNLPATRAPFKSNEWNLETMEPLH
ncbi:MAG: hypothetical protein FJ395_10245 [Verrucomicrobia bacterium]|nr:hypothetical protein [Verrucomicrobiota bacterium]